MDASYVVFAALAVLIVALAIGGILVARRRSVWRRFAAAHGLRYAGAPVPRVAGTIDRREVTLGAKDRSSASAELGAEPIRLSVRLGSDVPADLRIIETGSAVRAVHRLVDDAVIALNDEDFDGRFTVHARDSDAAVGYLNKIRRMALLTLAGENDAGFVGVRNGLLSIEGRMLLGSVERLNDALARLLACARTLDAASSPVEARARRASGGRAGA